MAICWFNGTISDAEDAKVSVYDHGLLYGDGVFEGIRFYHRIPFRIEDHLNRLKMSAQAILLDIPYSQEVLLEGLHHAIEIYGEDHGYVRMVVTRGIGKLGIDPISCSRSNVFMIVDQINLSNPSILEEGARLMIAGTRRLSADGLDPKIKSLNYLNHIIAKIEANQAGYDEAILLNQSGHVTEGTVDNVFIVEKGLLVTPPIADGALNGITRKVVIEVAEKENIKFQEKSLTPYDLYNADECFLTGTGAELIPVKEIMGRNLAFSRPIFNQLQKAFGKLTEYHSIEDEQAACHSKQKLIEQVA